jgi:hypothetical protein
MRMSAEMPNSSRNRTIMATVRGLLNGIDWVWVETHLLGVLLVAVLG